MNLTRAELEAEIDEKARDLQAFTSARDVVRRRVAEVAGSPSRLTPLPTWSGTDAVLGSLALAIHAIERTIEELRALLDRTPGEPRLRLVKTENENEHEG